MLTKDTKVEAQVYRPAVPSVRVALMLVTSLFFLWGLSYGLLDVLNKHFQETLHVSKAQSGLLQAAYFGAYFIIALPAGLLMDRFGYKAGILLGLCLYAAGALLFMPAANAASFPFFLFALFVISTALAYLLPLGALWWWRFMGRAVCVTRRCEGRWTAHLLMTGINPCGSELALGRALLRTL
jgi:FHS family L-fucose permease-like MFS transporter